MGRKPITSLSQQSDIVNSADQAFDLLLTSAISIGFWRFATTIAVLQKLNITPVGGYWAYAYSLPADYLKMVHLWPQLYDFEIYQDAQLYTSFNNSNQPLYIEYNFLPPETMLPAYFIKYFCYELACHLALSNAQLPDYTQELERKRVIELSIAQAADTQNRPQSPLRSQPMVALRFVSSFASG
jgi:hypothetical protein